VARTGPAASAWFAGLVASLCCLPLATEAPNEELLVKFQGLPHGRAGELIERRLGPRWFEHEPRQAVRARVSHPEGGRQAVTSTPGGGRATAQVHLLRARQLDMSVNTMGFGLSTREHIDIVLKMEPALDSA